MRGPDMRGLAQAFTRPARARPGRLPGLYEVNQEKSSLHPFAETPDTFKTCDWGRLRHTALFFQLVKNGHSPFLAQTRNGAHVETGDPAQDRLHWRRSRLLRQVGPAFPFRDDRKVTHVRSKHAA